MASEGTASGAAETTVTIASSPSSSPHPRPTLLRLRSPSNGVLARPSRPSLSLLDSWPKCSPFVSLTVLSAILLLLVPTEFLYPQQQSTELAFRREDEEDQSFQFFLDEKEFCCGGGPFSYYAASLISIPCERSQIHLCCAEHDVCYEHRHLNQSYCDDRFCACLDTIPSSAYCETVAKPGLCLATRVFGHLFHWSANCTADGQGRMPTECRALEGPVEEEKRNETERLKEMEGND